MGFEREKKPPPQVDFTSLTLEELAGLVRGGSRRAYEELSGRANGSTGGSRERNILAALDEEFTTGGWSFTDNKPPGRDEPKGLNGRRGLTLAHASEVDVDQTTFENVGGNRFLEQINDLVTIGIHPLLAFQAWRRRLGVRLDQQQPIHDAGMTIEEFDQAPVAGIVRRIRGTRRGGVKLEDWPAAARERLLQGILNKPDGSHPEHPNV